LIDAPALVSRAREVEAALEAARSEAEQSQEQAARAEWEAEQKREWHGRGLISRSELDLAETEAETARARVALARANLAQQEAMVAQVRALRNLTRLSAPFAGVISRKRVEPGAAVGEFDPVLTLADPRYLQFAWDNGAAYAEKLRPDMTLDVSFAAAPEKKFRGRIARIEDGGGRRRIIVEVENQRDELRPGMAARGSIELGWREDVLLVPRSAVILLGRKPQVYKAVGDRAVPQEVTLGEAFNQEIAISRGLEEGELVIVDQPDSLGAKSRIRLATAPGDR
jgi:RND family efflux transporter MFP subunit